MNRSSLRRTGAAGAALIALTIGLAACGDDSDSGTSAADDTTAAAATPTDDAPSDDTTTESTSDDAGSQTFGPGCSAIPADGKGSFNGMVTDPVATAASNNPLLKTLVKAVSGQLNPDVNLVDTLNGDEFTVFAPVDSAFAKLDAKTLKTLGTPAGADTLTSVLTYHVIPGQIAPADIDGSHKTVNGADLEVTGSGNDIKVGGDQATVICGGVKTANATVYLIDNVLMPPAA
jgi:uncharacterized surface protein with fasciclin (FAS1) repeats